MSTAGCCAAKKPATSLLTLSAVFLLRSCGAFVVPPTPASARGTPANKATDHGSAFGGVGLGWTSAADRIGLPGRVLDATSSSFVPEETSDNEQEEARRAAMASALVEMGKHKRGGEGGAGDRGGGRGGGGRERWRQGFRKARGAVARIWKRRGAPEAGKVQLQQDKVGQGVAVTSAAEASSMGIQKLPPGGRVVPPAITAVDTGDVQLWSDTMLRDDLYERKQRVLILMSDTGGGHRASAEALKAAFNDLYPGMIDITIVDIWTQHAPWPLNTFVGSYQFMAKRPFIWKALFEYGRFPPARKASKEFMNIRCHKRFQEMFEDYDPDLIVSVHPLCQEVPLRVLDKMGGGRRKIPFVTVVTDLGGAHPTWFHQGVDACFVPSERLAILARKCKLAPDQVRLCGLPIRPGFWREQSAKTELQEKLGLKPGVKTCLVVGGGDGVGGLEGIAHSLGRRLGREKRESQVVVICGKNEVVKASLESGNWAPNVHMHVKGFVSNMDEWMGAVDCVVTKAGPGTIAEATTRGLPIMLSAFLPGQEEGNVPYVVEGGYGSFSKNPEEIADTISDWLGNDELLATMSRNSKKASRPNATYQICGDIGGMLFSGDDVLFVEVPGRYIRVSDASIME